MSVAQWNQIKCVHQHEQECGPRTIASIHDMVNQINSGRTMFQIAHTMATYNILSTDFSSHSCRWLHYLVTDQSNTLNAYNPPLRPEPNPNTTNKRYKIDQQTTLTQVSHKNPSKESPLLRPAPRPKTKSTSPYLPPQREECNKSQIATIFTHAQDDNDGETVYYYSKTTVTDDIMFELHQSSIHTLSKKDQRHVNQYDATPQRSKLYDKSMTIVAILDKTTKLIERSYRTQQASSIDFYLTKRSNGKDTIIAWERVTLNKNKTEKEMKQAYNPTNYKASTPRACYTPDDECWGHTMGNKDDDTIRIIMENINNIPSHKDHNLKLDNGKKWLIENDVDVACWIETGVPWHQRHRQERLPELMREDSWDNQITITSNNIHDTCGKRQFGGTATLLFNHVASTMNGSGSDISGLGRWSWTQLQGKYGIATTIITAYCPCKGNLSSPETVYNQQRRYLMSLNRDVCPRKAFRTDLSQFIHQRVQKGDQIVLCIDLNEDVNRDNGPIQQTLLHRNQLTNLLKHKHDFPTPATHDRGTKTIDSIFVSSELIACKAIGWLPFGSGIGDHRVAFLDIKLERLICKDKYEIVRQTARRLQLKNQRSVNCYIELCEKDFLKDNFVDKLVNIRKNINCAGPRDHNR